VSKFIIGLFVTLTSSALIVLKLGTKNGAPIQYLDNKLHLNVNPTIVLGITLYGLSFLTYMYLLSKYDLGYIIPLTTALVYMIIFVASYLIFKETFTILKIVGITLIMVGLMLLNIKK
jgi:multidrug transporter EmrE-like cation transporter